MNPSSSRGHPEVANWDKQAWRVRWSRDKSLVLDQILTRTNRAIKDDPSRVKHRGLPACRSPPWGRHDVNIQSPTKQSSERTDSLSIIKCLILSDIYVHDMHTCVHPDSLCMGVRGSARTDYKRRQGGPAGHGCSKEGGEQRGGRKRLDLQNFSI